PAGCAGAPPLRALPGRRPRDARPARTPRGIRRSRQGTDGRSWPAAGWPSSPVARANPAPQREIFPSGCTGILAEAVTKRRQQAYLLTIFSGVHCLGHQGETPMLKRLLAPAVALMTFVAVHAADSVLRSDHPDRYVVQKGDTLWDIA